MAVRIPSDFHPENADNDPVIVRAWARRAVMRVDAYYGVLQRRKGSTPGDAGVRLGSKALDNDDLYQEFVKAFPDLDVAAPIDEDAMKSDEGKKRWREFIAYYKKRHEDMWKQRQREKEEEEGSRGGAKVKENMPDEEFNGGMLLRVRPEDDWSRPTTDEERAGMTILVTGMQYYAIEIARNKRGLNDWIFEQAEKKREAERTGGKK